jgi:hypothetical protein
VTVKNHQFKLVVLYCTRLEVTILSQFLTFDDLDGILLELTLPDDVRQMAEDRNVELATGLLMLNNDESVA